MPKAERLSEKWTVGQEAERGVYLLLKYITGFKISSFPFAEIWKENVEVLRFRVDKTHFIV